jgi:hypothetical protein
MDTPTITMERATAQQKLDQYERAARSNPRHVKGVDKGIAAGYRVLARGGRLVDVNDAIKAGGLNLAGQPKLAIARAHVEAVTWIPEMRGVWDSVTQKTTSYRTTGGGTFSYRSSRRQRITDDRVQWKIADDTFEQRIVHDRKNFRGMVPLIPLPLRPIKDLANYFVLWEANWHGVPVDPYLLKPLAGSLMEIVAEWDLTPLEVSAVKIAAVRQS